MRVIFRCINPAVVVAMTEAFADVPEFNIAEGDIFSGGMADAIISPANSFGHMDGGIDARYVQHFGRTLQVALYDAVAMLPGGQIPLGSACIVPTGDDAIPYMISTPTMVFPGPVPFSNHAYRAFLAALVAARDRGFSVLLCPGLATGTGRMPPEASALQMREAWRQFVEMPQATLMDLAGTRTVRLSLWRRWFHGSRAGVVFRWSSFWVGAHYSRFNRRLCINLLPFVTIWFTRRGGVVPRKA